MSQLDSMRPQILKALKVRGVRGFSVRTGWDDIDGNLAIFERAYTIAQEAGKALSIRVMAGRHTPMRVFNLGAYSYVDSKGYRIPKPFSDQGSIGNPVFEREYRQMVTTLATWSRSHGVHLLHLPWYGHMWAEIDNGTEIQRARGYSVKAWTTGHLTLLDAGLAATGPSLSVEYPMSGYWGGAGAEATKFHDRILNTVGPWSPRIFLQGNSHGASNFNPAAGKSFNTGLQMFDGGNYNWDAAYSSARSIGAAYLEVYTTSFTGDRTGKLAAGAAWFSDRVSGMCSAKARTTAAPNATIRSPEGGSKHRTGLMKIQGVATDDRGVARVNVAIRNEDTGKWWRRDGSWGRRQQQPAVLRDRGSERSRWHLRWRPRTSGRFVIVAKAVDVTGKTDPKPDHAKIRLTKRRR